MSDKIVKYAEILELSEKAVPEFMEAVRKELGYKARADKARDTYRNNLPYLGKLLCVERSRFDTAVKSGAVRSNLKFSEHFTALYGDGTMDTRAYSLSRTFSAFVLTEKLSEEEYDELIPVDALQRASRILAAVREDLNHPAIAEAATLLKKRSKKLLKELARLQDRIQEVTEGDGDKAITKIVFLTDAELTEQEQKKLLQPGVGEVQQIADQLVQSPTGLGACLAAVAATAQTTTDAGTAQILAQFPDRLTTALVANVVTAPDGATTPRFAPAQLNAWRNANEVAHVATEADTRAEFELALEMVNSTKELLKGANISVKDWLAGNASLIATPAAEVAAQ